MDTKGCQLVVFTVQGQRYALYLSAVDRIVHAVEVTPLPKAPKIVLGVVNVQGEIIPVVDIRKRFGLSGREISPDDHFIIARTSRRAVALVVDSATGVIERVDKEVTAPEKILPQMGYVAGVVKLEEGLVLIHNLEQFLSLDEEAALASALEDASNG